MEIGYTETMLGVPVVLWQGLIASVVTIVIGYLQLRTISIAKRSAEDAAGRVENVKRTLDDIKTVATDTHILVNSNMGVQLKLVAQVSRRLAHITKEPEDLEAAEAAEEAWLAHEKRQAVVDAAKQEAS